MGPYPIYDRKTDADAVWILFCRTILAFVGQFHVMEHRFADVNTPTTEPAAIPN